MTRRCRSKPSSRPSACAHARCEGHVLPRAGGLRRVEHRRARARDRARRLQRAHGRAKRGRSWRRRKPSRARPASATTSFATTSEPAARGDSRCRREAGLRPDLHRVAWAPRHQGTDARLADAEGSAARDDPGAGVVRREQHRARSDAGAARDHRRRASLARGGRPRPRIPGSRNRARGRHRRRPPLLHAIVHYVKEFPEKLHHPKEDAYLFPRLRARTSRIRRNARRARTAACRRAPRLIDELERSSGATTRPSRGGRLRPYSRPPSSASRRRRCSIWARDESDPARRARSI